MEKVPRKGSTIGVLYQTQIEAPAIWAFNETFLCDGVARLNVLSHRNCQPACVTAFHMADFMPNDEEKFVPIKRINKTGVKHDAGRPKEPDGKGIPCSIILDVNGG